MTKKIVCAMLIALAPNLYAATKAFDGNWVQIMRQQEPGETAFMEYYYDTNSFERNGDKVSYWERDVLADSKSSFMMLSVAHNVANCDTQQSAQIAFIAASGYDQVQLPSPDHMRESAPEYKSYPPNSPGAKILRYVCKIPH
ncbi:hypothetical protein P0D69_27985 [Paraburkholderia sediminicola]|uniref:surface-adhesin E family protein n=1 Tax=Paraburkholderia sediminicola TaxID=458836 RepID=UPI0038B92512